MRGGGKFSIWNLQKKLIPEKQGGINAIWPIKMKNKNKLGSGENFKNIVFAKGGPRFPIANALQSFSSPSKKGSHARCPPRNDNLGMKGWSQVCGRKRKKK